MPFANWYPVNSSHLNRVRYDAETGTLQIEFKSGAVYEWYGVQADTARDLITAPSPGRYLNSHLPGAGQRV